MILIISAAAALCSLGGNLFIMAKKRIGWLIWILGNILWIIENFLSEFNLPMVLMYVAYFIINLAGFIKWRKK